jgi:cytochrome c biogenesis protein CcdA
MAADLLLSFGAGVLSTLNPCVLPLLPIILFSVVQQHPLGPVALAAGLSLAFAGVGTLVALVGFGLGIDQAVLRTGAALLMVLLGAVLLLPAMQAKLAVAGAPVTAGAQSLIGRMPVGGPGGQFVLGALLGVVWSPCSGPTLGAAVTLAAQSETAGQAASMMAFFGLGAAAPVLALAYGSRQAIAKRRERLATLARIGKPLMGAALLLFGILVLTGFDKRLEAALLDAAPEWLIGLTTRF